MTSKKIFGPHTTYNRSTAITGNCFAFACGVTSVFPCKAWRVHETAIVSIVIIEETVCCSRTAAAIIIRMCEAAAGEKQPRNILNIVTSLQGDNISVMNMAKNYC